MSDATTEKVGADGLTPQQRGTARARVWTAQTEPLSPTDLLEELSARGFTPGLTGPEEQGAAMATADAQFTTGGAGYRVVSLSSSKGTGCLVRVDEAEADSLPDSYLAQRAVRRPRLVYSLEAGGPSNSDRALVENIAETLMLLGSGAVEISGRGPRAGNKPVIYTTRWLGEIKH